MGKDLRDSVRTFAQNMGRHVKRVVQRRETASEALAGVARDARKLRQVIGSGPVSEDREEAARLVAKGRKAYNAKHYERAERYFREAIAHDGLCGWGYTYLGHTLYKLGRFEEAMNAWERSVAASPGTESAANAAAKLRKLRNKVNDTLRELDGGE